MRFFFLVLFHSSSSGRTLTLSTLEQEDCHLSQVEVDEMSRLMGHVTAKVTPNNTVPSGVVLFVKLLLDERRNVLFDIVLLQSLCGAVDSILLHLLRHVGILDHGLSLCHCGGSALPLKGWVFVRPQLICLLTFNFVHHG